ncbi:ATP-binding protein [Streptomyces sp. NPDC057654]|uniref:ATP-binding protein n=1 Tax=Streptomyces sp. NPDC057654 TaxID=3346196 RepID=UPI0036C2F69B
MSARARSVTAVPTSIAPDEVEYWFASHRRSAGLARAALRQQLRQWGIGGETVDVAELLLAELVANAVEAQAQAQAQAQAETEAEPAAGQVVGVRFTLKAPGLRVEVADTAEGWPVVNQAEEGDECGRGLAVVAALADAWGVASYEGGKSVWAELAITMVTVR